MKKADRIIQRALIGYAEAIMTTATNRKMRTKACEWARRINRYHCRSIAPGARTAKRADVSANDGVKRRPHDRG